MSKTLQAALPSSLPSSLGAAQDAAQNIAQELGGLSQLLCFEDNSLLPELFGARAQRLKRLAQTYGVELDHRGNKVVCRGSDAACQKARAHLLALYARLKGCESLNDEDGAFPQNMPEEIPAEEISSNAANALSAASSFASRSATSWSLNFPKVSLAPRNAKQEAFLCALAEHPLVFATGPAGTGKTCIALGYGMSLLLRGDVERVILSRPVVEAGERLGFLPGDMREKVDPYLRPIFDLLHRWFGKTATERHLAQGRLEIAPLSFMRGRTIENAFLLFDEAQNTSPQQMKMVLTRLGMGSRIVVTGDPSQTDLPATSGNGLVDAERRLKAIVPFVRFSRQEVVRHPLVAKVLQAYERSKHDLEKPELAKRELEARAWGERKARQNMTSPSPSPCPSPMPIPSPSALPSALLREEETASEPPPHIVRLQTESPLWQKDRIEQVHRAAEAAMAFLATDDETSENLSEIKSEIKSKIKLVVSILCTDEQRMRELNRRFRNKDTACDSLAFPAQDENESENNEQNFAQNDDQGLHDQGLHDQDWEDSTRGFLGDLALGYEGLQRSIEAHRLDALAHCAHMTIHGVLHLKGFRHDSDEERTTMEAAEETILARLGFTDLHPLALP